MTQIKSDPKERFNRLVKESLTPFMKSLGFKKKALHYHKIQEPLTWIITLRKPRWNNKESVSFTIDWGFFVPNCWLPPVQDPKTVEAARSAIYGCLKDSEDKQSWFHMTDTDESPAEMDQQYGAYITETIQNHVISVFESVTTVKQIIHLLETTPDKERFWSAPLTGAMTQEKIAMLYRVVGEKEKGIAVLDKIIEESQAPRFQAYKDGVIKFRKQYIASSYPDIILE